MKIAERLLLRVKACCLQVERAAGSGLGLEYKQASTSLTFAFCGGSKAGVAALSGLFLAAGRCPGAEDGRSFLNALAPPPMSGCRMCLSWAPGQDRRHRNRPQRDAKRQKRFARDARIALRHGHSTWRHFCGGPPPVRKDHEVRPIAVKTVIGLRLPELLVGFVYSRPFQRRAGREHLMHACK